MATRNREIKSSKPSNRKAAPSQNIVKDETQRDELTDDQLEAVDGGSFQWGVGRGIIIQGG
jgi:hypothetical protein